LQNTCRHEGHPAYPKPLPQSIDHRQERRHIGRIPGPQFTAQRPAVYIQHQSHDHLGQIRSVVFTLTVLSNLLATLAFEIDRGGIEKDQIDGTEEIPALIEQFLFNPIL
jgi:hypothetical protein